MTTDSTELAIVRGISDAIFAAGLPRPFVRAGERVHTSWGCERNRRLKSREAIIRTVTLGLYREPRSMWYRPAYQYVGNEIREGSGYQGMCLRRIRRIDGAEWEVEDWKGSWSPFYFRMEWVSPLHGGIETAYEGPFREESDHAAPVRPADATTIPVMLACNDEHGIFDGACSALVVGREFAGPHLQLEGDSEDPDELKLDARGFTLAGHTVDFRRRRRQVGNVLWDEFEVSPGEVARLLNHLRRLKHWQATVGSVELYDRWQAGRPFTAEDLAEVDGEGRTDA